MPETDVRDLLQAGLHFGHQTRRWNPRTGRYIWGEQRDGIHVIDLLQTQVLLDQVRDFAARSRPGAAPCSSWARRSRPAMASGSGPTSAACPTSTSAGWAACSPTSTDLEADRPPPRARRPEERRPAGPAPDQGAHVHGGRAREAHLQPRRRPRHGAPARRDRHHRREDRGDRPARGGDPADPDHRAGRLERRPGQHQLPDPRQRRRQPLLRHGDPHPGPGDLGLGLEVPRGRGQAQGPGKPAPPPRGEAARARGRGARRARPPRGRQGGRGEGQGRRGTDAPAAPASAGSGTQAAPSAKPAGGKVPDPTSEGKE